MIESVRRAMARGTPALLTLLLLPVACSDDPTDEDDPDFSLSVVTAPPATTLGTTVDFTIRVRSTDYEGPVSLAVEDAPDGWTVELDDAQHELDADETITVGGTITIATDADAAESGAAVVISGTGDPGTRSTTLTVTVADEVVLTSPAGTGGTNHWGALEDHVLRLRVGTTLEIRNADATAHRVHTSDIITGLGHQLASMGTGQAYVATIGGTGTDAHIYCHDHGTDPAGEFTILVE